MYDEPRGVLLSAIVLLLALALDATALAQSSPKNPGIGDDALPAVHRVSVATTAPAGVAFAATTAYGRTESVLGDDDSHHRFMGRLGASLRPVDWLALSLRVGGRYDRHKRGPEGNDEGLAATSALAARAVHALNDAIHLGGQLGVAFPGAQDLGSGFAAATPEARVFASYAPGQQPYTLTGQLGYRLDRTRHAVDDPDVLSLADRLALGASEADALLLGLGGSWRVGPVDVLGEWTWEPLLEHAALLESPMRVAGGARYWLTSAWQLSAILEVSPSARPEVARGVPLVPVEPRYALWLGLAWQLAVGPDEALPTPPPPPPVAAPAPEPPAPRLLRGRVTGAEAGPIAGADVWLGSGDQARRVVTDADGHFVFDEPPSMAAELRVVATGWHEALREVPAAQAEPDAALLEVVLQPLPRGQIRGRVRNFRGEALTAQVRIEPLGRALTTGEDGEFRVDVLPGDYTVVVEAPGHAAQQRPARVEEKGVTVLVVDMRRSP